MDSLKIINITDLHLTDKRYAGRKDDFKQTQLNKLEEIGRMIKKEQENTDNKINELIVLINGDMFDTPRISQLFLIKIANIIISWGVDVYVVPGNHDLYNDNIVTLKKTHLGLLATFGIVKILEHKNPVIFDIDGFLLGLQGKEYSIGMEHDDENYMYTGEEEVDFKMLSVHGMLMDEEPPFDYFTLVEDVKDKTNADILTTGHYHPGFKDIIEEDFAMYNPKSMIRTKRIKSNTKRIPGGKLLTFAPGKEKLSFKIENFELKESFIPYEDAFKEGELEEFKATKSTYEDFKNNISDVNIRQELSHEEVLRRVADEKGLDEEIIKNAIEYIGEMEEKSDENNILEGYETSDIKVTLDKLTIENFMCYDSIEVDFSKGTTAFIGRSGNGKSTILRAIKWLYYDEPSGSDFIQTGQTRATVTGEFSNGYKLTRSRTNSSTGTYIITDPKGNKKTLKNFSHDFPVEVLNVHQTPKVDLFNNGPEDLSFSNQLDQHFLITTSGGNIATAIGNLAHTNSIDKAIKEVKRKISNQNSEVKGFQKRIDEKKEELENFETLDNLQKNIDILDRLMNEKKNYEETIEDNHNLIDSIAESIDLIDELKEKLSNIPNLDLIVKKHEESIDKFKRLSQLNKIESNIKTSKKDIKLFKEKLDSIPKLGIIQHNLSQAKGLNNKLKTLTDCKTNINKATKLIKVNKEGLQNIPELKLIENKIKDNERNVSKLNKNSNLIKNFKNTNERIAKLEEELKHIPDIANVELAIKKYEKFSQLHGHNIKIINFVKEQDTLIEKNKKEKENFSKRIENGNNSIQKVIDIRERIINENSICPLCGTKDLSKEHMENVLKRG